MLSANVKYRERMSPGEFGGLVASGTHIYAGALCAWTVTNTIVRVGDGAAVSFAGMASGERDNTAGTETRPLPLRKGTWAITVAGATAANVGQPVYATADATAVLGAVTASAVAGAANTGAGTVTAGPTAGAAAIPGTYVLVFTGATTFKVVGPGGISLAAGASLAAYSSGGLGFTITAGSPAFVAGDYFVFTVAVAAGGLPIGTLAGIEGTQTFVKLG